MKSKLLSAIIFTLTLFFVIPLCAQKKEKELDEDQRINMTFLFFNGQKEKIGGNLDKAADHFAQCLRIDGSNDAAMYELAQIYLQQQKLNDAFFFAKSAAQTNPSNQWYQTLLAQLYQRTSKFAEAAEVYENLVKTNPENIDYYFEWANALIFNEKLSDAIKVYDKIEQLTGINREVIIQKERLYLRMNKTDKAAAELQRLINYDPKDILNYSLLVELYQVNGMNDKAMEVIKKMKEVDPQNPQVYLALAEFYRATGEKEKSFEQLKMAVSSPDLESSAKIKIMTSYLPIVEQNEDMMQQAVELGKIFAESTPNEAEAQAIYGDFLSISKKHSQAREQYRKALKLDGKNLAVWQQLLYCEIQLNDFKSLMDESNEALSLFPDQPSVYLLNGIAKYRNKFYEEAVKVLLTGSKMVVDNNPQLAEFYSNLGDNYNELKNFSESDKFYEKCLELEPNNEYVLNNYSYYLSLRNEKLNKAEAMSKLSNQISPANPSFQDTYAWVLYKLGKYPEAKEWLEKAMNNGGATNGTILEHYGDVLYKLNDQAKAMEYWQKAKDAGEYSELLEKKLAEKKLYE